MPKDKKLTKGDKIAIIVTCSALGVGLIIFLFLYFTHKLDHSTTSIKLCKPLSKNNPKGVPVTTERIYSGNYSNLQKNTCYSNKDIVYEGVGFIKHIDLHTQKMSKEVGDNICQKHGYKQMCNYKNVPPKCGGLNDSETGYYLTDDGTVKSGLWTQPGNIGWNTNECLPVNIQNKHPEGIYCCGDGNFIADKDNNIETFNNNNTRNNFRNSIISYESNKIDNKLNKVISIDKNNNKFEEIIKCFENDSQAMNAGIFNELSYCNSKTGKIRTKQNGVWQDNLKNQNCYCNYAYNSDGKNLNTKGNVILCENKKYINDVIDSSSLKKQVWCNKDDNKLYQGNKPAENMLNNYCSCHK